MKQKSYKIGFFYYSFYPVSGGASVHGYNLAKELVKRGHKIYSLNGVEDPYTEKKQGILGLIYILLVCDVVFVRLDYFIKPRNFIPIVAKLFGKKIIAELNSPADELYLLGRKEAAINKADRYMKFLSKFVDRMLVVSPPIKEYCEKQLGIENVTVVENGGEVFNSTGLSISEGFKNKIGSISSAYDRILVWAGSPNKMQEMDFIYEIGKYLEPHYALVLISKDPLKPSSPLSDHDNIFMFSELQRDEVKSIIIYSDFGLALYEEYSWSRWGFYNSSLKAYEYLANGLFVITNKEELLKINKHIKILRKPSEINELIKKVNFEDLETDEIRTWSKVAEEFEQQLAKVESSE